MYINSDLQKNAYRSKFIDDTELLDADSTDWSKDISLNFPVLNGKNVACYVKLCYYRQKNSNIVHRSANSENQSAFNTVFASLDTPNLGNDEYGFRHSFNSGFPFIKGELPNGQTFSGVAEAGANFDANRVIFHTKMLFPKETTGEFYLNTSSGINKGLDLEGKFNQMSFLKRDTYCTTDTIQEEINTEPVKILDVSAYNGYPNNKESLFILGITQSELSTLKNVTGLSDKHNRYIVFEDILPDPAIDINGKSYKKYKLNMQGLDENEEVFVVSPSQDIFVYTDSDFIFCSKDL